MTTLAKRFEEEAGALGEKITECVIGYDEYQWDERWPAKNTGVIPWAEAAPLLAHNWHAGYGGADCPPIYAWSKTMVFFVSEYDGATSINSMPRNPIPCEPGYP